MNSLFNRKYNEKSFNDKEFKPIKLNLHPNNKKKVTRIIKRQNENKYILNQNTFISNRLPITLNTRNINKVHSLQTSYEPNSFNNSQNSLINIQVKNFSLNNKVSGIQKNQKKLLKNRKCLFLNTNINNFLLDKENINKQKINSEIFKIDMFLNNFTYSQFPKLSDRGNSNDLTNRRTQESLNMKNSSNNIIKSKLVIKAKPSKVNNDIKQKTKLLSSFDFILNDSKGTIEESKRCITEENNIFPQKNISIKKDKFCIFGVNKLLNKNKFKANKNSETNDIYDVLNDFTNYMLDFKTVNKERQERKNMKTLVKKLNMNKINIKEKNIFSTKKNLVYEDYISQFIENFE